MKKMHVLALGMALSTLFTTTSGAVAEKLDDRGAPHHHKLNKAKNIIFMVPDGMGLADVTATRIHKNGPNGDRLSFEQLPVIGYQRTHSANSTVTDSAAAASAWATGQKFINGEISCHEEFGRECDSAPQTVLEIAKEHGKATGLVATSQISHATPAAFGAHTFSRYCGVEIARQYLEETAVDVILGGGVYKSKDFCAVYPLSINWDQDDIVASALTHDYRVVQTRSELADALDNDEHKVLGLFTAYNQGKTPETYRVDPSLTYPAEEPTLPEMTEAALDILEESRDGFFLVVEGSQIDWENHDNNITGKLGEMLAFEESVAKVQEWLSEDPRRQKQTLLVVVADHDTGGFAINGPYGLLSEAGDVVEEGWTSGSHTAVDTVIWSQGPGSRALGRALDNTDLFKVMVDALAD